MPNRLWYLAASWLFPQADSSIACAMVTAAGTPQRCWAATAPGAIRLMNACWSRVPGVVACCLVDELADDPEGEAAGGVVEGRDRLAGAVFGLAAGSPRSWPVARTPGTSPLADSPVPAFPAPGPAPGMPPVPASATPPGRPGTVT